MFAAQVNVAQNQPKGLSLVILFIYFYRHVAVVNN